MSKMIAETEFRDFFDEARDAGEIVVLDQSEAREVWARYFGTSRGSYFKLPDSSWVVAGKGKALGRWIEDMNTGTDLFAKELRSGVPWNKDSSVFFAVNSRLMLSCTWRVFLDNWRCFLYLESDASMILAKEKIGQCVLFRSVGDAVWIEIDSKSDS